MAPSRKSSKTLKKFPMGFPIGSEIEVRSNEEGFRGAWFEAIVTKHLVKYRRCTVLFTTLVSEDAPTKPLEDTVHTSYIRPRPPKNTREKFEKYQLVEAFHNDAWWKGVVREVKSRSYSVCFPLSREEFEFKWDEMREMMEWVKGDWVLAKDFGQGDDNIKYDVGSRVEVSMDKINYGAIWFVGTVTRVIGKSNILVTYESAKVNDDENNVMPLEEIIDLQYIRPVPPPTLELNKPFNISEEVEAFINGGWVATLILEIRPDSKYSVKFKHEGEEEIELDQSAIRHRMEWKNKKWVQLSQQAQEQIKKRKGRKPAKYNIDYYDPTMKQPALVVTKRRNGRKASKKKYTYMNRMANQFQGRKAMVLGVSPPSQTITIYESNKAVNAPGDTPAVDVGSLCTHNMQADIMGDSPDNNIVSTELNSDNCIVSTELNSDNHIVSTELNSDNRVSTELNSDNNQVFPNISENVATFEGATIVPNASIDIEDRVPVNPSSSQSSLSREDNIPHESTRNAHTELPPKEASLVQEERLLPFTKESTMWEIVESMEVFKTLPQKPHFRPLEQYEVEFREGAAIGLMVTFASLVDGIKKLKITDSQDIFEEKLKTLVPLEMNGFNVQLVRSRLDKLLEIQSSASQSAGRKVSLKEKMIEGDEEKDQLDMLIVAHDKVIIELEENLKRCREKRASLVMRSNKNDSERILLKMDLQATEEAFASAEENFNASVDAPW